MSILVFSGTSMELLSIKSLSMEFVFTTTRSQKILRRQSRVFLEGSKEINDSSNIGQLANEISLKFSIPVEITLEFEKVTKEEVDDNSFNFPQKKALPIVGID